MEERSVCSILEHTAADGKRYKTQYYNLDAVLSVGYRVNSRNATQFRIWANKILKDYLVKGYVHNEKLLREKTEQYEGLKQAMKLLGNVIYSKSLDSDGQDLYPRPSCSFGSWKRTIFSTGLMALRK